MTFLKVIQGSENIALHSENEINTQQSGYQVTHSLCTKTRLQPECRDARFFRDGICVPMAVFAWKVNSAVYLDSGFSVGMSANLTELWMAVGYVN